MEAVLDWSGHTPVFHAVYDMEGIHMTFIQFVYDMEGSHMTFIQFVYDMEDSHMTFIQFVYDMEGIHMTFIQFVYDMEGIHMTFIQFVYDMEGIHMTFIQFVYDMEDSHMTFIQFVYDMEGSHMTFIQFVYDMEGIHMTFIQFVYDMEGIHMTSSAVYIQWWAKRWSDHGLTSRTSSAMPACVFRMSAQLILFIATRTKPFIYLGTCLHDMLAVAAILLSSRQAAWVCIVYLLLLLRHLQSPQCWLVLKESFWQLTKSVIVQRSVDRKRREATVLFVTLEEHLETGKKEKILSLDLLLKGAVRRQMINIQYFLDGDAVNGIFGLSPLFL